MDFLADGEPVIENWGVVVSGPIVGEQASSRVLDVLEFEDFDGEP